MISSKIAQLSSMRKILLAQNSSNVFQIRSKTHFRSGALKPKPDEMPFGIVRVVGAVVPGLFIGAAISKSVANFLEENELFVPSEDDDED